MDTKILALITAGLSLTLAGCSTTMFNDQPSAPVDNMSVSGSPQNNAPTTVAPTTVTPASSVVLSGSIGGDVGKLLDDTDNAKINHILESTKTNQTVTWTNTSANITYSVIPTRTFSSPTGEPCRDFTTTAVINGQTQSVYSTACRDSVGEWHVVS